MNKMVNEKVESHQVFLDMMMNGPNHLRQTAPKAKEETNLAQLPLVKTLWGQMKEIEKIKEERETIRSKIKVINPDVKIIFCKTYNETGCIKEEELSKEILDKEFYNIQEAIEDNLNQQSELINKIKANHSELNKSNVFGSCARDEMFRQLAAAYDAFYEVKGKLEKETAVYDGLIESIIKLQCNLNDFCLALDIEKEDMIEDIESIDFYDAKSDL